MEIIIKPVLTEKMTKLTDTQNKVAFLVAKDANKIEIKKAVEEIRIPVPPISSQQEYETFAFQVDTMDIEDMDEFELCQKAEDMGIDLHDFEV